MNVFLKDYGHRVAAEFRVGPIVTCEAAAIKSPEGWIVDGIETLQGFRRKGHATAVLESFKQASGMPLLTESIDPGAEEFWHRMTELELRRGGDTFA